MRENTEKQLTAKMQNRNLIIMAKTNEKLRNASGSTGFAMQTKNRAGKNYPQGTKTHSNLKT